MASQAQVCCFKVHARDNVATMLEDGEQGTVQVLGGASEDLVELCESVQLGHKLALRDIAQGEPIIKYGETIGVASRAIQRGGWVHLHNVTSEFDSRSQTLDVHSGATTDTVYE